MLRPVETIAARAEIYSVSRLNREARLILTMSFPLLWVEGEVSNLARAASGHLYFTLKDDGACIRCAMFKNHCMYLRFAPRDGAKVLVRARVGLYEPRGEFQLTIEHMEEAGFGAAQRAFELVKHKLAAEGLFDSGRKKTLPRFPRRVGIITSPIGAAIRDVVSTLRRRFPPLAVLIYPVPVQGQAAAQAIADSLALADRRKDCDVLILARGGGSLEDLWAFNTEIVVRAIAACRIPVVSGVGHEIDFTIADLTADQRAATPTAAAEMVSPDKSESLAWLSQIDYRLCQCMQRRCQVSSQALNWLTGRLDLQHPRQRLQRQSQRVDEVEQRLRAATRFRLNSCAEKLGGLSMRTQRASPRVQLAQAAARYQGLAHRAVGAIRRSMDTRRHRADSLARALQAISPLATLERGYAYVTRATDDVPLRHGNEVSLGEALNIRLARGRLSAEVTGRTEAEGDDKDAV
jgi:exodeoxyribonuclease VII large subunit